MKPLARSYSATPLEVLMCFPTCKHSRICSCCWTTSLGTESASELICSKAERPEATICLHWRGWWMNSTQTVDVKQTSVGNMRNTKWAHKLHFVWTLFPPLAEAVNVTTLVRVWCNDVIQTEIITREGKKKTLCHFKTPQTTDYVTSLCVFSTDSEMLPLDCLRPRSFAASQRASIQRNGDDPRLSISLCDLSQQQQEANLEEDDEEEEQLQPLSSASCHVPQNSQNSQQCSMLPSHLDTDLHFHLVHGIHVTVLDKHTVARLDHRGDERTLVFTSRPMRCSETVFVKVKAGVTRPGCLSYGVTSCDPATLRPSDLPSNPESLVDRKEFWAVCRVGVPLHGRDILGFVANAEGEAMMSHTGVSAGMQLCVDNSRPLWMFYGLHGTITQLRILGLSLHLLWACVDFR